jgi:hypothetical protein
MGEVGFLSRNYDQISADTIPADDITNSALDREKSTLDGASCVHPMAGKSSSIPIE